MSLSERTPGYLKRSQVPPTALRDSRIVKVFPGISHFSRLANQMPLGPAPTINTSTCSLMRPSYNIWAQNIGEVGQGLVMDSGGGGKGSAG